MNACQHGLDQIQKAAWYFAFGYQHARGKRRDMSDVCIRETYIVAFLSYLSCNLTFFLP